MTKVCYLGDYGQFLSAKAARQIEEPILPRWAETLGTKSFSCARPLPHPEPQRPLGLPFLRGPSETSAQHAAVEPARQHAATFPQLLWIGEVEGEREEPFHPLPTVARFR